MKNSRYVYNTLGEYYEVFDSQLKETVFVSLNKAKAQNVHTKLVNGESIDEIVLED